MPVRVRREIPFSRSMLNENWSMLRNIKNAMCLLPVRSSNKNVYAGIGVFTLFILVGISVSTVFDVLVELLRTKKIEVAIRTCSLLGIGLFIFLWCISAYFYDKLVGYGFRRSINSIMYSFSLVIPCIFIKYLVGDLILRSVSLDSLIALVITISLSSCSIYSMQKNFLEHQKDYERITERDMFIRGMVVWICQFILANVLLWIILFPNDSLSNIFHLYPKYYWE
ncbi:hypothetical protein NEOKW01_0574 [Nematocida sp. AWRm80]|nr:hypothetical protein NEOKW01_0574 [Nematocida sp. AWRm80]